MFAAGGRPHRSWGQPDLLLYTLRERGRNVKFGPVSQEYWEDLATRALRTLLRERSVLVRPEAEAILKETFWVSQTFGVPAKRSQPDPHHITTARRNLEQTGELLRNVKYPNGVPVPVWVDARARHTWGSQTEVSRAEGTKRRLYRCFLTWSGNSKLCGQPAERILHASLAALSGTNLWLPPESKPGHLPRLGARQFPSPLDSGGYWPLDRSDPTTGAIPFAVEMKNVRGWIFRRKPEVWGLLSKLCHHPDVVPILVARRIQYMTFRFFKAIGVIGHETRRQWFHSPGTHRNNLDSKKLAAVATELSFHDVTYLPDPDKPDQRLTNFFTDADVKETASVSRSVLYRSKERWQQAAPYVKQYTDLAKKGLTNEQRNELWDDFRGTIESAGIDITNPDYD